MKHDCVWKIWNHLWVGGKRRYSKWVMECEICNERSYWYHTHINDQEVYRIILSEDLEMKLVDEIFDKALEEETGD